MYKWYSDCFSFRNCAFWCVVLITQVLLGFRCKNKIEAVLVDVEISKTEDGSQRVAVPHESRYSKYSSYSYKPKKEFVNKKQIDMHIVLYTSMSTIIIALPDIL